MDDQVLRAHDLWSRGQELLDRRTESALREGIHLLTSVLDLVPATDFRVLVHHDIAIGHWRLAKLGYPEHAVVAADHALQACQTEVSYVLAKGSIEDLERNMRVLAGVLTVTGMEVSRMRE